MKISTLLKMEKIDMNESLIGWLAVVGIVFLFGFIMVKDKVNFPRNHNAQL